METITSAVGELAIRHAVEADLKAILDLLLDCALWLCSKDIDQWKHWVDPGEKDIAQLKRDIQGREMHIIERETEIIGTIKLQWNDSILWKAGEMEAGYIHTLSIKRSYAGYNIGFDVLKWAECEIKRNGRKYMRLDCMAENKRLCCFYEKFGFIRCGSVSAANWKTFKYEKYVR